MEKETYLNIRTHCIVSNHSVTQDGNLIITSPLLPRDAEMPPEGAHFLSSNEQFLHDLYGMLQFYYRKSGFSYRKFFKMDNLSKLGFLASEVLLEGQIDRTAANTDIAIILFNSNASQDIDTRYQETIEDDNYFPRPSEFVYTLPNIVAGEIAIRNQIFGETAFFISEQFDAFALVSRVTNVLQDGHQKCICGWVEYSRGQYEACLFLVVKETEKRRLFNVSEVTRIYNESA
jgi:hypothetical protein